MYIYIRSVEIEQSAF